MTIEERVERLKRCVKEQEAQRQWLLDVNWEDSGGDAAKAAMEHDRIIEMYGELIRKLEARL